MKKKKKKRRKSHNFNETKIFIYINNTYLSIQKKYG